MNSIPVNNHASALFLQAVVNIKSILFVFKETQRTQHEFLNQISAKNRRTRHFKTQKKKNKKDLSRGQVDN